MADLAILVLGAIEAHGPHLPPETDTIIGVHVAERAADTLREDGLDVEVVDPFIETAAICASAFPETVHTPADREADLLVQRIQDLFFAGHDRVCVLTLHFDPAHTDALHEAIARLAEDERERLLYPRFTRRDHVERIGGEFATGDCHGGAFETSLVLAADATRVNPIYTELASNEVGLVAAIGEGRFAFEEIGMDQGYCGVPAEASVKEGERLTDVLAGIVVEICRGKGAD